MSAKLRFGFLESALAAVAILILAVRALTMPAKARGLTVSIAVPSSGLCGDNDQLLFAFARPDGLVTLNQEHPLNQDQLDLKLKDIFNHRSDRLIFAIGEPEATYGQMVTLVGTATGRVDRVALLTHTVMRAPGTCGVPSLPPPPRPILLLRDLKPVPLRPW
jgi:biopolymer transport protein ExbD